MKEFCVYKHTFPNGKVYIGITGNQPEKRWQQGKGYGKTQARMHNAITKYGWDNIAHEVVADGLTREEACSMEIELIAEYDSTNPQNGYNSKSGGDLQDTEIQAARSNSLKTRWESENARENHSKKIKECWKDEKYRNNQRERSKELWKNEDYRNFMSSAMKGKSKSEETKTHMRLSWTEDRKKAYSTHNSGSGNPRAKKVMCVETEVVYSTIKEAATVTGANYGSVSQCCKGKLKTAGGYTWKLI